MNRPALERRYRRLLRSDPRGRRRAELLDTLLDAAPAGCTRPTLRESADLLRNGLWAPLGRPASRGVVVLAVLVAALVLTLPMAALLALAAAGVVIFAGHRPPADPYAVSITERGDAGA